MDGSAENVLHDSFQSDFREMRLHSKGVKIYFFLKFVWLRVRFKASVCIGCAVRFKINTT